MKKLLIPVIIVAVIGAIITVLFFFKDAPVGQGDRTIGSFFPFGNGGNSLNGDSDTIFPPTGDTGDTDEDYDGGFVFLRQLHDSPVTGIVVFNDDQEDGFVPLVRFMESSVGHIYETYALVLEKRRISNETFTGIYNALWSADGEGVAFMQVDDGSVTTFTAELSGDSATSSDGLFEEGSYLPEDIVSASSFGNELFYLYPASGGIVGTVASFNGGGKDQVFDSLLTEWLASWANKNTILLTTKPSAGIPGYAYTLNVGSEQTTQILDNIPGLTASMSPNEKYIIYSEGTSRGLTTFLYNTDTGEISSLPSNTLPEKCVWSVNEVSSIYCAVPNLLPQAAYPDSWYKGLISFSDSIWKIDVETSVVQVISTPEIEVGVQMDAIKLMLSPNEDYLVFINKKDSTPWSLQLIAPTPPEEEFILDDIDFEEDLDLEVSS